MPCGPCRTHASVLWLACVVAASMCLTLRAAVDDPPPYEGSLRALVYSDRRISDADRAQLVHLVADIVQRQYWRTVDVDKNTTLDKLVDCYYDAFVEDTGTRHTAIALMEEIRKQSPLVEWPPQERTAVMMPPFPAIAMRKQLPGTSRFRAYDTVRDAYSITDRVSQLSSSTLQRVADQPLVTGTSKCPARLAKRDATFTAIIVPVDPPREAVLRSRLPATVQQLSVGANAQLGRVRIELLQDGGSAICLENVNYLTQSPFWNDLKSLAATLGAQLVKAAADVPLVILDQNFAEAEGHGFKVANVATTVLKELQLPEPIEKALIAQVTHVELCPTTAKDIADLSARVAKALPASESPALDAERRQQAEAWLARLGEPCFENEFDVPDLVLASVLRRELAEKRWLIMSFRARGTVESLLRGAFDLPSISVVAAGNQQGVLDDQWMPQIQASKTQRVILVTHGDDKGVLGTSSNLDHEGLKVDTIAPGCGVGEKWTPGSSFAAPIVAVAVWLKALVKKASAAAGPDEADLRSAVTAASRPSVTIGNKVQAAGLFDLSRYVVAPIRHIRFRENAAGRGGLPLVMPVTRGHFAIECSSATDGRIEGVGNRDQTVLWTLMPDPERTTVVTRQLGIGSRLLRLSECAQGSSGTFTLNLTYGDKTTETFDWNKFKEQVAEVSF